MSRIQVSDNQVGRFLPLVEIDGERDDAVMDRMLGMRVEEHEGGRSSCLLELRATGPDEAGALGLPFEHIDPGAALTLYAGDQIAPTEIFRGHVSAIEALFDGERGGRLRLHAEDGLDRLRTHRRTRSWIDTNLRDIVTEVARDAGSPTVEGGASLDTQLPQVVQLDETDLAFLRRLLATTGHDLQMVGDELHVVEIGAGGRAAFELVYGVDLLRATVIADLADQVQAVTALAYDPSRDNRAEPQRVDALDPGETPPAGGRTAGVFLDRLGGVRELHLRRPLHPSAERARALAEAEFRRRAERFVVLEGETIGSPELRCGARVEIRELAPRFDHGYRLRRVVHVADLSEGYRCFITAVSPWLGEA